MSKEVPVTDPAAPVQDLVLETPFHHIVHAEDVGVPGCICGDYKSNHIDGAGLCRICRTFPDAPGIPCQRYEPVGEKRCLRS